MSLIYTAKDGIGAVVLGDVLITSTAQSRARPQITSHLRPAAEDSERVITGLVSKVHILRQNLALAWAGSEIGCRDLLRFWDFHLPELPSFPDIAAIVMSYDASHDSEIVGSLIGEKEIFSFKYLVQERIIKRGSQFFGGTGTDFFLEKVRQKPFLFSRRNRSLKKDDLGLGRLALWALHRMSDLPALELFGHQTLESWFGCGYDFAFAQQRQFRRISSLYQVFYQVTIRPPDIPTGFKLRPMNFLLTQTYQRNGLILLRNMKIKFDSGSSHNTIHVAPVLSTEEREVEPIVAERQYRGGGSEGNFTRVTLLFEKEDAFIWETSFIYGHPNTEFTVELVRASMPDEIACIFKLSPAFVAKIAEKIQKVDGLA